MLEEIRLLSGIETSKEKVLRIILAGQPELRETLDSDNLKQLVQRVRLRFHLGALDERDMHAYIEHRVHVAGREEPGLFAEDAFPVIYRYSGGVPRLINTICDSSLLVGFADERDQITAEDVEATAAELGWQVHEETTGTHHALARLVPKSRQKDYVTRLEVLRDGKRIADHFFESGRIIVGRSPDNEVYIDSKFISRHHAQLVSSDEGCLLEDLNSTNGIYMNDAPVKRQVLADGDVISIGVHQLVYHDLRGLDDGPLDADEEQPDDGDEPGEEESAVGEG